MAVPGLLAFLGIFALVIQFTIAFYLVSLVGRVARAAERMADALEAHQDVPVALGRIAKAIEER